MPFVRARRFSGLLFLLPLFACASGGGGSDSQSSSVVQSQPGDPDWPTPGPLEQRVPQIDVEHYDLAIHLLVATKEIQGRLKMDFVSTSSRPIQSIRLDCAELTVQRVEDSAGVDLAFSQVGDELVIELDRELPDRTQESVTIEYQGKPRKGLYFVAGDPVEQVFTQGECEGTRYWFPCIDQTSDRATSSLTVRMPRHWVSLAAGDRMDSREVNDSRVESWRMTTPHPAYLTTLVAGVFERQKGFAGHVPLELLLPEESKDSGPALAHVTGAALSFMEGLTGRPYPYTKYGTSWVQDFPFGGMENISATTLTDRSLGGVRGMRDTNPFSLIAHEAAHQWFGDLLTAEDWSHIWLHEGFATYAAAEFMRRLEGEEAHLARWRVMRNRFLARDTGGNARPLVYGTCIDPFDLFFSGHAYQGGALFLAYLRSYLGDDQFDRGVKEFVGTHANRSVNTADLLKAMEHVAGRSLVRFFDQWANQPGHPEFESSWSYDAEKGRVLISLNQVHSTSGGLPKALVGSISAEVRTNQGRKLHKLYFAQRRQLLEIPCSSLPLWVRLDPEGVLPADLFEKRGEREWLALAEAGIAEGDDDGQTIDITARLQALDHFINDRSEIPEGLRDARVQVVRKLAHSDPNPIVQEQAIKGLLQLSGEASREALRFLARSSKHTQVRVAALKAMLQLEPVEITAGFAKATYDVGYSWGTMGAALALWEHADAEAGWQAIQESAALPDARKAFAPALIASSQDVEAELRVPWLMSLAGRDYKGTRLRVEALKALGGHLDYPGVEELTIGSLKSPYLSIVATAVTSLTGKLTPPGRAALVEHYHTCLDARQKRQIEAAIHSIPTDNVGTQG